MAYTPITSNPFVVPGTEAGFLDIRKRGTTGPIVTVAVPAYSGGDGGTPAPTQLAAPTGLAATPTDAATIGVSWNPVANSIAYQLQRALVTNDVVGMYTTIYSLSDTSYMDGGRTAGNTYAYRVLAAGNGTTYMNSPYSDVAQATPVTPTVLRAVRTDGHSVNTPYPSGTGEGLADKLSTILGTTSYTDFRSPAVPGQTAGSMLQRLRTGGSDAYGGAAYAGSTLPDRTGMPFGIDTVLGALNDLDPIAQLRNSGDIAGADAKLAELKATYQAYVAEANAKNWQVILLEEAAAQGTDPRYAGALNAAYFAEQRAWNNWLLANFEALGAKAIVRTMNDARFANPAATSNAASYVDRTHLTEGGRAYLASYVAQAIVRVSAGESKVIIAMNPLAAIDLLISHFDIPPTQYLSNRFVANDGSFSATNGDIVFSRADIQGVYGKDIAAARFVDIRFLRDGAAPKVSAEYDGDGATGAGGKQVGTYDCAIAAGAADGFETFSILADPIQLEFRLKSLYQAPAAGDKQYFKSIRFRTN